ncbi:hypothetical protein [Spirillospora sp. NPDC048823]|uniref:hypothetical protein n=1 Tax=Spirillospora sp. NPDC048823 TaxID=3364525 RepID=UPI003719A752
MVKRWNVSQDRAGSSPTSSVTTHLDRLSTEVIREGWQTLRRYDGPHPLLRVFDPAVPHFGESVSLVHESTSRTWWYQSSTGENLAPYNRPGLAAARITRILIPFVTAVLAARTHRETAIDVTCPDIPSAPDPAQAVTVAKLQERFAGVICWWGLSTKEWWALIPGGTQWQIVNAADPDDLVQAVLEARPER